MKVILGTVFAAVAALVAAGPAAGAPTGGASAADAMQQLTEQGYSVQLNGSVTAPLNQCTVTGVHGVPAGDHATSFTTVYMDVDCPSDS